MNIFLRFAAVVCIAWPGVTHAQLVDKQGYVIPAPEPSRNEMFDDLVTPRLPPAVTTLPPAAPPAPRDYLTTFPQDNGPNDRPRYSTGDTTSSYSTPQGFTPDDTTSSYTTTTTPLDQRPGR